MNQKQRDEFVRLLGEGDLAHSDIILAVDRLMARVEEFESERESIISTAENMGGRRPSSASDAMDAAVSALREMGRRKADHQTRADKAEARVEVLEKAQTLRPMADVPIGDTLVLARHTSLGWLSVARACDDLEFRGRQGLAWSGEYFHGWIPMPVLPDQSGEGG